MKRLILFSLTTCLLLFSGLVPAVAQIIRPVPGVFTDPSWLSIDYQRVSVEIDNQIATTNIDMQFTNQGNALAEGTFIFPLPEGAAVDQLTMYIDGQPIEARILAASEARAIYDEIVRQYRDPALLEYIGQGAIQANVFPIPPGESRRIEIRYSQVLEIDGGLFKYVYPLHATANENRVVDMMSISVEVNSSDPISSIYSPTHNIAIIRSEGDRSFRTGFEQSNYVPAEDFTLYYGIADGAIDVSLLTYRESANEDGFFMLLVQPPLEVNRENVIPRDIIIVLDQSGSMQGVKWDQARDAAGYVLENLNPEDRFNIVSFSSGVRLYSREMVSPDEAGEAIKWMSGMDAAGATDINLALLTALDMVSAQRSAAILFLTDGEATEGVIETPAILANLSEADQPNARIFAFGVGYDLNTVLLDSITRDFRGTGAYVRPQERIDEAVASLYNKISSPVLTNTSLEFGDAWVEMLYPVEMPDLFAGEQLTIVGRYRESVDDLVITLNGEVEDEHHSFIYQGLELRERAGGEAFIARLWATRRIGDLLNSIRLQGENPELVDSVVSLSLRYGIITPYTSFLIEEDDILTQQGRQRMLDTFADEAESLAGSVTGEAAVDAASNVGGMTRAEAPAMMPLPRPTPTMSGDRGGGGDDFDAPGRPVNAIRTIESKTFILQNDVWTDTTFEPDTMETEEIVFLSDAYFDLLDTVPELAAYLTLGDHLIVVFEGTAYEIVPE